jgi:membrane-associated phospholipid phosphatase
MDRALILTAVLSVACAAPALAQEPSPKPVASFIRAVADDLKRLPTLTNAAILGTAAGASVITGPHDASLTRRAAGSAGLEEVLDPGDYLGLGGVQVGGALAAYGVGLLAHSERVRTVGGDLARAQLLNGALTHTIKAIARRQRPDGSGGAFPSGHTSASFATAAVLQRHLGWKAGVPAYAAAVYIGISRMSENRHYASDVMFGAAIGLVSGRAVTVGHGRARFAVTPLPVSGVGIQLALVR